MTAELITRREAARILSVKQSTLRRWWMENRGPRGVKLHPHSTGRVLYPRHEVERFAADPIGYPRPARPENLPKYGEPCRRKLRGRDRD